MEGHKTPGATWGLGQTSVYLLWVMSHSLSPFLPQTMDKVTVPSVTLIVGCGVSSLTLLMLVIIYVSVWR